ncbi:MAG TPA: hypothetical protein VKU02_00360, partial [Gemmataceae bacterium]|nr:hypothetical protein [Gemmataceae bacterium]
MAEVSPTDDDRPEEGHALGALSPERLALAAYLGHQPARRLLGPASPPMGTLQSMRLGGDRPWRKAIRALGHEPAAVAACAIAELALRAYLAAPDAPLEVEALARDAVGALQSWRRDTRSELRRAEVAERGAGFCLAVDVGGRFSKERGFRASSLSRVVGRCYSVVLAPETRRHVRWLGEAADETCRLLDVPGATVWEAVAAALLPYVLAPVGGTST